MANERIMQEFIAGIARLNVPGQMIADADGVEYPYSADSHNEGEDAQALYRLIEEARKLTAEIESEAAEQEGLEHYRTAAAIVWSKEGEIEIDPGAVVSVSNDGGAYVQGWLWVYDGDAGVNREEE